MSLYLCICLATCYNVERQSGMSGASIQGGLELSSALDAICVGNGLGDYGSTSSEDEMNVEAHSRQRFRATCMIRLDRVT